MKLSEFYYELPKELIAKEPLKERDSARLLVLDRSSGSISEGIFSDIKEYLCEGDCIVLNDTRVIPARLFGRRATGGKVEIFLLNPFSGKVKALIRPSKRIKEGEEIVLENGVKARVGGAADVGRFVEFDSGINDVFEGGHVPLPPYIDREDIHEDKNDYQTVYAKKDGATASPTAGLHFTRDLIDQIEAGGIKAAYVTLHTSYGTFSPVKEKNIEDHAMHSEFYELKQEAADLINNARSSGGRIISIGTTSTRVLETCADENGRLNPSSGETDLFVYPGYKFKAVDAMITNFHLPESTLLMLISAFAGKDLVFEAYKKAIDDKFRFFSYGDAMLIL